jgi:hypothetical protein
MTYDWPAETESSDMPEIGQEKRAALSYLSEAFAEARHDGLDGDCLAHAAIFTAFHELVETYGEEAVAVFAENLPSRIRSGAFTVANRH